MRKHKQLALWQDIRLLTSLAASKISKANIISATTNAIFTCLYLFLIFFASFISKFINKSIEHDLHATLKGTLWWG